jgi:CMP-N-acetylneuraminic acid synthetase
MKIVAIIPIKKNSERIKKKNFKIINGKPFYRFLLDKLKKCNFDEVYIDSDSEIIKNYCNKNNFKFISRLKKLSGNNANGNDLINYHQKIINADVYFQLFVTAPLLSVSTINKCIDIMKKNNKFDSILTSRSLYTWFWFKKNPVNYNPKILPRSQDCKPVIQETTGLYGIRKAALKKFKARIGNKPYFYDVPYQEALDIDELIDLQLLKFLIKNK